MTLIIPVVFMVSFLCNAQKQVWDYPIKSGTPQWKTYKSTPDLVAAIQLPDAILKNISTEDLLTVCMNYPFLGHYSASNSMYEGIMTTTSSFNGFVEFFKRKDAPTIFFNYYKKKRIEDIEISESIGGFTFEICGIELLLTHEGIFQKYSKDEQTEIFKLLMKNSLKKKTYDKYFGFLGKMTTTFVANKYAKLIGKKVVMSKDEKVQMSKELFENLKPYINDGDISKEE